MDKWLQNKTNLVMLINKRHFTTVIEEQALQPDTSIHKGAILLIGKSTAMKEKVLHVEFKDEKSRFYRVVTTRFYLNAEEITEYTVTDG